MWKKRLTNYNFWISMISAGLLLLQAFDFEFDILYVNEILTAILGLLVVIGIVVDPTRTVVSEKVADSKKIVKEETAGSTSTATQESTKKAVEEVAEPIHEKIENSQDFVEIDWQTLINKIAKDLDDLRREIYQPDSSSKVVEKIEDIETKIMGQVQDSIIGHSIVNN